MNNKISVELTTDEVNYLIEKLESCLPYVQIGESLDIRDLIDKLNKEIVVERFRRLVKQ